MISETPVSEPAIIEMNDFGTRNVVESAIELSKLSHTTLWESPRNEGVRQWDNAPLDPAIGEEGLLAN